MRFSDPRQSAGHSSERQMAYAAKWAAEHGLLLDESLSLRDEGLSAYHQRHVKSGALGVFLVAVEQGRIPQGSVLVVEGLDAPGGRRRGARLRRQAANPPAGGRHV